MNGFFAVTDSVCYTCRKLEERLFYLDKIQNMSEILVVDDDIQVLTVTGEVLRDHGYEVSLCQTPGKAIKLLKQNPQRFEVILLDWKLRCAIDGDMVVKLINRFFPGFKAQFIFITAHRNASIYLMRLGAYDILVKPVTAEQLVDAVERALKKKPPEDPHQKVPSELNWQDLKKHEMAAKIVNAISSTETIVEAARLLGCSRKSLYRWLLKTGLHDFVIVKEL